MKKILVSAASAISLVSTAALAQTAMVIDPETGNYIPAPDPLNSDPNAATPNPNRLGNRMSLRNARTTAPPVARSAPLPGHAGENDGLTPAQRAAAHAAYNGRALPASGILTRNGQPEAVTADGFVSLGDMAAYGGSSEQSLDNQKPDWWPK